MPADVLHSPFGAFELSRYPSTPDRSLRAWDAADENILEHVSTQHIKDARFLLVNDTFGALACALNEFNIDHWSDSWLSQCAVKKNYRSNRLAAEPGFIKSIDELEGTYDYVLIKVPKTTALLEDQLSRLHGHLHAASVVIGAGMVRHLNRSSFQCFEKVFGSVQTSLAKKKARLLFSGVDTSITPTVRKPTEFVDAELGFPLYGYANVFSRQRLDAGARFFLNTFDQLPAAAKVADLGCGNGVLGIACQRLQPAAHVTFIDESYMAIESARLGYRHLFPDNTASFVVGDGLKEFESGSLDLVLCNPPFHQQHTIAEQTATTMFSESLRCLRDGAELWVVANRHLPYRRVLRRLFGQCELAAAGLRYTVYRMVKGW